MRIVIPPVIIPEDKPFENDKFGREDLAKSFSNFLSNSEGSFVLAIDGQWGVGKSTFVQMLNQHLRNDGFVTTYLDAFAVDYVGNPFQPIFSRIHSWAEENADAFDKADHFSKKLLKAGAKVARTLVWGAANFATSGLLKEFVPNIMKMDSEEVAKKIADLSQASAEKWLAGFSEEEESIEGFREMLTTLAKRIADKAKEANANNSRPLVFFIDELDRCKPSFAIAFLEHIKHFFSVENLVFVLVMNKSQMEVSIRHAYGNEVDGNTYLQKFVHAWISLPHVETNEDYPSRNSKFITEQLSIHGLDKIWLQNYYELEKYIIKVCRTFSLTLREIERMISLLSIARLTLKSVGRYPFEKMLIAGAFLKVVWPEYYRLCIIEGNEPQLSDKNPPSRNNLRELSSDIVSNEPSLTFRVLIWDALKSNSDSVSLREYPWKRRAEFLRNALEFFNEK
jgi:hypothetical protein